MEEKTREKKTQKNKIIAIHFKFIGRQRVRNESHSAYWQNYAANFSSAPRTGFAPEPVTPQVCECAKCQMREMYLLTGLIKHGHEILRSSITSIFGHVFVFAFYA